MIKNSICITEYNNKIISWYEANSKMEQLAITDPEGDIVNNIYVGKIKHILKNINACFVEFKKDTLGFLSFNEIMPDYTIQEGLDIPVQVIKEASKNKEAVLTTRLSIAGTYSIVEVGDNKVSVSKKISGDKRNELRTLINNNDYNVIIRTNASELDDMDLLLGEVASLSDTLTSILAKYKTRELYNVLYESDPQYLSFIKSIPFNDYDRIITDIESIYNNLKEYNCALYTDSSYPMAKLYSLETKINELLSRQIWLRSGSNIVFDYTEAMTVIDVNSAKNLSKKNQEDNILALNKEAAKEIARQLRLRNISGIIIIDFINMHEENSRIELINYIKELLNKDTVRCDYVDITKLGLIELVRKKIKPPIYEILNK